MQPEALWGTNIVSSAKRTLSSFMSMLNDKQADLLRFLSRQGAGPVSSADLDGRVIRALRSRGCISDARPGWVQVTDLGRSALETTLPERPRRGRRSNAEKSSGYARAQAIRRALDVLESAVPSEAEVAVGAIFAYADDVVDGFRRYARRLERSDRDQD